MKKIIGVLLLGMAGLFFAGCSGEPEIKATDENIKEVVQQEIKRLGNDADLNHIDVSEVTNMKGLFSGSKFNGDISQWNVSKVEDMRSMFKGSEFNGDISKWNVSKVKNMSYMFDESKFNGDVSKWDFSNPRDLSWMFSESPAAEKYGASGEYFWDESFRNK